ncbi:MAG: TonB family protein [Gemmatimonadales bacterium]
MFDQLVESRPRRERTAGGMLVSVVVHGVLISGAAIATNSIAEPPAVIESESTLFVMRPPPLPALPVQQQRLTPIAHAQPQGFQAVEPPNRIPTDIPPVELSERFDASRFSGRRINGGPPDGVPGLPTPDSVLTGHGFTIDQVDDQAVYLGGAEPRYPGVLRMAGVEGRVTLEFVVGTDGRVEASTVKVMATTNTDFDAASTLAIRGSRFRPAKIGGRPVRQLVRQVVRFTIER